ncbi:MAG: metabolite traffic protein EboE [Flavobacteriaceae bacterium]
MVPAIKKAISAENSFGLGLRLSNKASEELNTGDNFELFRNWLAAEDIYVFTMNGFPYGNFHNERVKDRVYAPDWTTTERVSYTKRLFDQLAALIPEGIAGGISTLPISYKHWHSSEDDVQRVFTKGAENISEIVLHLHQIEKTTAKYLHLDIEPEPDCLLENSEEFISFFESHLIPIASKKLQQTLGVDKEEAKRLILRYVTLCYDICHFSLAYEEPIETFRKLESRGISIGKIQVSAALKMLFDEENEDKVWQSLAPFDEPIYLHQVTEKIGDKVKTYNDLPALFQNKKAFTELRAHFHVPIFLERFEALYSTQDQILAVLEILKTQTVSEHLEVETYTWDVLPAALKMDITGSIIRELSWLKERI